MGILQARILEWAALPSSKKEKKKLLLPHLEETRKGRGTRDQIANIHWIIEKSIEFQKNIYFCFIHYNKAFDCVDHKKNYGKFWKRWEYQTTWSAPWETYMQLRKEQLELDMEQQTGSK